VITIESRAFSHVHKLWSSRGEDAIKNIVLKSEIFTVEITKSLRRLMQVSRNGKG
jgi:hypothetical protein